jgi:sugar phosphate permease
MSYKSPPEVSDKSRASRGRFTLATWLCGLAAVLYLDRICMAQAVPSIQKELGLSNTQMSYVMMAFTLAYGIFELPAGRMGDQYGSRRVLTRIVVWWSVFTSLTGVCTGLVSLVLVRFMFGAGEAGAFPNTASVITRWYPPHERGRIQGVMLSCAQFGAVLAPVCAAALIELVGWRWSFACFGAIGIVWAAGFSWWFRDDPAEHPAVNRAELATIQRAASHASPRHSSIPWSAVLGNRGIWTLSGITFFAAFYTYFFYSWFPKYLESARGLSNQATGTIASLVLLGSALGTLAGGWLTDSIIHHSEDSLKVRRHLCGCCFLLTAIFLRLGISSESTTRLTLLCGISFCLMHVTLPCWWSVAMPQCGKHIGALCGLMNGFGSFGALLSQWFVGVYSDWQASLGRSGRAQWDSMFDVYVISLILAAAGWWSYRYRPLSDP